MGRVYDGRVRVLLLAILLTLPAACSSGYAKGSVNGISFSTATGRDAVPGGVPVSIRVEMNPGSATQGRVFVDGVDYGPVTTGDSVRVDKDAVVRVNGKLRAAASAAQAPQAG